MGAAVKLAISIKRGRYSTHNTQIDITNTIIKNFVDVHNKNKNLLSIDELVKDVKLYTKGFKLMSRGSMAGFYLLFHEKSKDKAIEFFEKFTSGVQLNIDSPILFLRNILQNNLLSNSKFTTKHKNVLMVKTWNAFVNGIK